MTYCQECNGRTWEYEPGTMTCKQGHHFHPPSTPSTAPTTLVVPAELPVPVTVSPPPIAPVPLRDQARYWLYGAATAASGSILTLFIERLL